MSPEDTIAAISTPIGPAGIGIVRLSGPDALRIADKLIKSKEPLASRASHTMALAKIIDPITKDRVDEALITVMRAPNSYTREDIVEINCHSGTPTLRSVLKLALAQGARLAEPGEFTRRAFLSGRIDLTQAQAVISLVQARSEAAARAAARQAGGHLSEKINGCRLELIGMAAELEAAVDFVDEDIEPLDAKKVCARLQAIGDELAKLITLAARGKILDHGLATVILGRPNVGKSSLLNALAMEDKAIVSEQSGTTRDIVETQVLLGDIPLRVKDTAGWRVPGDDIEAQGIARTRRAMIDADLAILVLDGSEPLRPEDHDLIRLMRGEKAMITAINKSDIEQKLDKKELPSSLRERPIVRISAKRGDGLGELSGQVSAMVGLLDGPEGNEAILISARQEQDLLGAEAKLTAAVDAHRRGYGEEVISSLVKDAITELGRVSGDDVSEEILNQIFSRFCIGK